MKWRVSRSQHWFEAWLQAVPTWLVVTGIVLGISLLKVSVKVEELSPLPRTPAVAIYEKTVNALLEDVEAVVAVVAAILYVKGVPERRRQRHYEAWYAIDRAAAAKMSISYARYEAMQNLHNDGLSLQGIEAPRANLEAIELPEAELCGCDLRGANLKKANLAGADLRGSNLRNADLEGANLSQANLVSSDLTGAKLRGAILWEAKLWEADLTDADFRWAEMHKQVFKGSLRANTTMPDGTVVDRDERSPSPSQSSSTQ